MGEKEDSQARDARKRSSPSSKVVHLAILREGFEELARPVSALFWSALAAGLSMGLSMIAEGLLRTHLPDAEWRPLIVKFGYSMGFLVVIFGRQQLFTENTLTGVLPVLEDRSLATLVRLLRLWAVVLAGNLAGCAALAWAAVRTNAFDAPVRAAFVDIGREALQHSWTDALIRGVAAGWIIALIVWLLPFAETSRFYLIVLLTYFIALGHLTHVVAGSIEAFTVAATGERSWAGVFGSYTVPSLAGNILGGVTLVAALNHAQVVAGGGQQHEE
jgi:formate-nitrite transporter family protein